MSTRGQKRKITFQGSAENVSENVVSPILIKNGGLREPDVMIAGPSHPKSPRNENSTLESMRASLEEELTSEFKNLLVESQREHV